MRPPQDPALLFADAWKDGQAERIGQVWNFEHVLPVNRIAFTCGLCGGQHLILRTWNFHLRTRGGSQTPWRCDVSYKCVSCGDVSGIGVDLPQAVYARAMQEGLTTGVVEWRDGKKILAAQGYPITTKEQGP